MTDYLPAGQPGVVIQVRVAISGRAGNPRQELAIAALIASLVSDAAVPVSGAILPAVADA
jgi:hypothetical protein